MSKMMKLYRLNRDEAKTLNISAFNPTCKAILKAMYRIEKENADNPDFPGSTGDFILQYAVKHHLWATRQAPEKYYTTWAYYRKVLMEKAGVYEAGKIIGLTTEEYLDEEEFLDEAMAGEPSNEEPEDFEDVADEATEEVHQEDQPSDEEAELQRMIDEEEATQLQAAE